MKTTPVTLPRRYPPAPLVGVAAVVFDADGRVLLVQRANPPRQDSWGLPGGLLDLGESLRDGVRREVREECAIEIEVGGLVDAFEPLERDADGRVVYHYVVLDFWARHRSGTASAGDDAAAVAWCSVDALEPYRLAPKTLAVIHKAHVAWNGDGE